MAGNSNRTTGGTGCGDALSVAWFNNSSSWGTASHQISAGTTVYLCGTFVGKPGEELLTVRGDGASGNPITIKFIPGAVLSAPFWSASGAIHADGRKYIVIDGGTNGIIQNTQNGTSLAYHQQSVAVHVAGCTSCTVQNLTIQNLYVRTSNTDYAPTHSIHCVYWHDANSLTVSHITCHDAAWAITGEGDNFTLEYSNIYRVDHGIASGPSVAIGGYKIHHNHFHDFANWDSPANTYHHDGIHLWGQRGGSVSSGSIYSNTFDGDFGVNVTGHIFLQDSVKHVAVFNNVFNTPTTRIIISVWFGAGATTSLPGGAATGNSAYNNSINAGGHRAGGSLYADNQLQFTAVNNALAGGSFDIYLQRGTTLSSTGINYNLYRDLFAEFGDSNTFGLHGATYHYLAAWRSACRCDSASTLVAGLLTTVSSSVYSTSGPDTVAASPALTSDGNMTELSTAGPSDTGIMDYLSKVGEGNGLNLSELATGELEALGFDKNGKERPASGPWNIGPN